MRHIFSSLLLIILFSSCTKENTSKIDIYLLKSFSLTTDQTTNPFTQKISNAVLSETPFIVDQDIQFYTKSETTFQLSRDIKDIIKNYGPDKAFAVTVDNQPVYYGLFHPGYLSSMTIGVPTIDPIFYFNNQIKIQFVLITGSSDLLTLDNRNDSRLINSLKTSGRLR